MPFLPIEPQLLHLDPASYAGALTTEGRVTLVDGLLATVLLGLLLNGRAGWWWADPLTGYVLVFYATGARSPPICDGG